MKIQIRVISGIILLNLVLAGCSKNNNSISSLSLKESLNQGSAVLNKAVSAISATKAYSVFTVNDGTSKSSAASDSIYKVYIPLDKISGVYEYKPVTTYDKWGISLIKYFNRTSDNSNMIVKLPLSKVQKPHTLRHYSAADSALTNNFSISVSGYHNNYNSYWDYDYLLASEITIDGTVAGNLNIKTIISPTKGTDYSSQFAFAGSYTAQYKYLSGDTTVSSFSITESNKVLYEEKLLTIKNDTARFGREHQYILTIGDVQIVRKNRTDSAKVYVGGVLQPDAVVKIIDKEADSEASVCKHRDIQITFEDGTVTTVSALIGNSVDNIATIFDSLHSVYFAAYIVDWIAYDIYYERN
jgi:hypothetical protein